MIPADRPTPSHRRAKARLRRLWPAGFAALVAVSGVFAAVALTGPAGAAAGLDPLQVAIAQRANCQLLAAHPTSSAQLTRARQCVTDQSRIITLQDPPASSPTPPATGTPTPGPTVGPTTPPPATTPPATTPPATTPPATTPAATTPPPSTTPPASTGCLAHPAACGYPDTTTTGVPAGTVLLVHAGNYYARTAGEVISNLEITGCLYVGAANVTVRNSKIGTGNDCYYTVRNGVVPAEGDWPGLTIVDSDIRMAALPGAYGVSYDNYHLTRVRFTEAPGTSGADCAYLGTNVIIEDSYCWIAPYPGLGLDDPSAPHFDGFSSSGGKGIVIRHNTVINTNVENSAILMSTNDGAISDVVIDNNLLDGGGYTLYCGANGVVAAGETLTNNRLGRHNRWGPTTLCDKVAVASGNIWDDTGAPVPLA